jgi:uncharacterized protein GlcG (DUF336 family)
MLAVLTCGTTGVQGAAVESPLLNVKLLPLSLAVEAAETAISACAKQGFKVSANVVDRDGAVKVVLVGDGAKRFTVDFSRRKAYTASIISGQFGRLCEASSSDAGRRDRYARG